MFRKASCLFVIAVLVGGCSAPQPAAPPAVPTAVQHTGDLDAQPAGPDFDAFLEDSFRELMLRDPEGLVETGLDKIYSVTEVQLTNVSDAYVRETQQIVRATLDRLRAYDRAALTPDQQLSYDIYEWYLDDLTRGDEFMYYSYPVTFMVNSIHWDTQQFFTEIHPFATKQDAEDYVARLALLGPKIDQMVEALRLREEAGIVPPYLVLNGTLPEIRRLAGGPATVSPYYLTLEQKIEGIEGLSDAEKDALLDAAEEAVGDGVIPAYIRLADMMLHLTAFASPSGSVRQFENGAAFYSYLLRHETSTGLSADEIHTLGLQELERIHAEMRAVFDELGYPQDASLPALYDRVAQESGLVAGSEAVQYFVTLLDEADQNLSSVFDIRPTAELIVIGGLQGNFYVSGAFDGSRPGAFYANTSSAGPRFNMPTIAYHEGIPGHHFQLSIQQEADLPTFRKLVQFNAFIEGWALYAEQLAYELGWYEGDPYGNLGRLQMQALRAARLVVDTGIHARGWGFEQAVSFMAENTGYPYDAAQGEVARYIAWPAQATSYMVGMLQIMRLRQEAMQRLGDRFDLVEFHHLLLENGAMPLDVLERVVEGYIEGTLEG